MSIKSDIDKINAKWYGASSTDGDYSKLSASNEICKLIASSLPDMSEDEIRKTNPYPEMIRGGRTYGDARVWEDGFEAGAQAYKDIIKKELEG